MRDVWDQLTGAVAAETTLQLQPHLQQSSTKAEGTLSTAQNGQAGDPAASSLQDGQIAALARKLVSMQALGLSLHRDAPAGP
jgi:hypothetical protein